MANPDASQIGLTPEQLAQQQALQGTNLSGNVPFVAPTGGGGGAGGAYTGFGDDMTVSSGVDPTPAVGVSVNPNTSQGTGAGNFGFQSTGNPVIDAQGSLNTQGALTTTALNRPDVITPFGSTTWSVDPNDPSKQTATIGMTPEQLALYKSTSGSTTAGSNTSYNNGTSGSVQGSQQEAQNTSTNQSTSSGSNWNTAVSKATSEGASQNSSTNQSTNQSTNTAQNSSENTSQNTSSNVSQNTSESQAENQSTSKAVSAGQNTSNSVSENQSTSSGVSKAKSESTETDKAMLAAMLKLMPELEAKLGQNVQQTVPNQNFQDALRTNQGNINDITGAVNSQQNVAGGINALQQAMQAKLAGVYGSDFNYGGVQTALPDASDATRKAVEDALYAKSTSRLDPQFQQAQSDLSSRLAAQGITQGSEAYNREMMNLSRAQTDAYENARNSSIAMSTDDMVKQFNAQLSGRQQGVTEANTLRSMPTQEALATGVLGSQAASGLGTLAGTQVSQQATAAQAAQAQQAADLAASKEQFTQQQAGLKNLMDYMATLKTGGQATTSTSEAVQSGQSTGSSLGTSQGTTSSLSEGQSTGTSSSSGQGTSSGSSQGSSSGSSQGSSSGQSTGSSSGSSQGTSSSSSASDSLSGGAGVTTAQSSGNSQGTSSGSSFGNSSSSNSGGSSGTTTGTSGSTSYNLPNFTTIGNNTGGQVVAPNLINYQTGVDAASTSSNNADTAGIAGLIGSVLGMGGDSLIGGMLSSL
jgi:hypothetical protein